MKKLKKLASKNDVQSNLFEVMNGNEFSNLLEKIKGLASKDLIIRFDYLWAKIELQKFYKECTKNNSKSKLPVLFDEDDKPVLDLIISQIGKKLKEEELISTLKELDKSLDFTICALNKNEENTKLRCKNLRTSCLLQIYSLTNKITWSKKHEYGIGVVQVIAPKKIIIVQNCPQLFEQSDFFCKIWHNSELAEDVLSYLSPKDQVNLYLASHKHISVLKTVHRMIFTTNWPLYIGPEPTTELCQSLQLLQPNSIKFSYPHKSKIVLKILKYIFHNYDRECKDSPINLELLDFRNVCLNTTICNYISKNFNVREIKISRTAGSIDDGFIPKLTENLLAYDCFGFNFDKLLTDNFQSLVSLNLFNCKKLKFESLAAFLTTSKTLKELILTNCQADDKDFPATKLLEIIFSSSCKLASFTYNYSKPLKVIEQTKNQPLLEVQPMLIHLDISNNMTFANLVVDIVSKIPYVKNLNILGLPCANLNLSKLTTLTSLQMSHSLDITHSITSINSDVFHDLEVSTLDSFHKNTFFDLNELRPLISRLRYFKFRFYRCQILEIPGWLEFLDREKRVLVTLMESKNDGMCISLRKF